jgi:K+-sensing histidine kinase KdpD
MMEVIDEESDRLSRFINGLIELARIEAGELQLRRRWGAVDEIISAHLSRAEPITRNIALSSTLKKSCRVCASMNVPSVKSCTR